MTILQTYRHSLTQTQVTFIQIQIHSQFILTNQSHLKTALHIQIQVLKQAKQIIMNIDTLSHSPTLQNKLLQELNLHGLCKYNSMQQASLYENSNKIVN